MTMQIRSHKPFQNYLMASDAQRKSIKWFFKHGVKQVIQAARRVPQLLKEPLKQELSRMEEAGIIVRMEEPSDWVSPLVVVRKKVNKLRVCMDPRLVNESLKREHYEMPRREDIEAELAGARFFFRVLAEIGDDAHPPLDSFLGPRSRHL
ncbi:uncharacterized protein ISCGN_012250 [Ixodes scapularis]